MEAAHACTEDRLPAEEPGDRGSFPDAEAAAAELSTTAEPLGTRGKPLNHRSPFLIGMADAAGVAVVYGLVQIVVGREDVLVLIGLALFLAIGLEPAVAWLTRHRFPRWLAVVTVFIVGLLVLGGFLTAAIPVVVEQVTQFIGKAPGYLHGAQNHNTFLGQINERFHLQQQIAGLVNGPASAAAYSAPAKPSSVR